MGEFVGDLRIRGVEILNVWGGDMDMYIVGGDWVVVGFSCWCGLWFGCYGYWKWCCFCIVVVLEFFESVGLKCF